MAEMTMTKTAPATPWPEYLLELKGQLEQHTTEDLRTMLQDAARFTADKIKLMAALFRTLEERGEDIQIIGLGIVQYVRRIAFGQLLPDVFVRYMGQPKVLNILSRLPLPDQQKVSGEDPIHVSVIEQNGEASYRKVHPTKMNDNEIKQVFAYDHIRSEAEQVRYLTGSDRRPVHKRRHVNRSDISVDRRGRCIVVSGENVKITLSELIDYVAQISPKS